MIIWIKVLSTHQRIDLIGDEGFGFGLYMKQIFAFLSNNKTNSL